jgi:hypothetical protein
MSIEIPESLKEQFSNLSPQEKFALAEFLLKEAEKETGAKGESDAMKRRQLEWLKANREKYAGQYVALDGERLVGHGATLREASEQARLNKSENPFIFRVFSEETPVSAGL